MENGLGVRGSTDVRDLRRLLEDYKVHNTGLRAASRRDERLPIGVWPRHEVAPHRENNAMSTGAVRGRGVLN